MTDFDAAAEAIANGLDRRDSLIRELCEALEAITHYAECNVAAFSDGRGYLDMTAMPSLCKSARAVLAKARGV